MKKKKLLLLLKFYGKLISLMKLERFPERMEIRGGQFFSLKDHIGF